MKTKKRIASILAAAVLTLNGAMAVSAANTSDAYYGKSDVASDSSFTTGKRDKDNDSYVYVKLSTGDKAKYRVYGDGFLMFNKDCTMGSSDKTLRKGQKGFISNSVNENGYDECYLKVTNQSGKKTTIDGYWSPDSENEYGSNVVYM